MNSKIHAARKLDKKPKSKVRTQRIKKNTRAGFHTA